MRVDVPSQDVLAGAVSWEPVVSSWLGGEYLGEVPVSSGSVAWSTNREVPGSVELTVPRWVDGVDWLPRLDASHPLARFGQTLHVSVRITSVVSGEVFTPRVGTFLVTDWEDGGDTVSVTGVSMFRRIEDSRFTSPVPSRTNGTLASELRRIVPASLGVVVDDLLEDRPVPLMAWGEPRMDAVREIAAAWPARLRETAYGEVAVLAPLPDVPVPVATLHDGERGTVVSAYRSDTRDGAYNTVTVRGQETDDAGNPMFQRTAQELSGPMAANGPYGVVNKFFSSPLITSRTVAYSAARNMVADSLRPSRTVPVVLAPDPSWELDDAVEVRSDGDRLWGYVSGVQLPLTTADGDMRLDVEVAV